MNINAEILLKQYFYVDLCDISNLNKSKLFKSGMPMYTYYFRSCDQITMFKLAPRYTPKQTCHVCIRLTFSTRSEHGSFKNELMRSSKFERSLT
jgi:hypothetical protein